MKTIRHWLNPRSLISSRTLNEIYKFEDYSQYARFHPSVVKEHATTCRREIDIPEPVLDAYHAVGRPTPLLRASAYEKLLGTTNKIFLKREDYLTNGSFKSASSIPQAYFGAKEGKKGIVTETAAGQTGVASALAANLFGLSSTIFMVRSSYELKVLRRAIMEFWGATVHPSPSNLTHVGKELIEKGEVNGSIALATSEVMEIIENDRNKFNIAGSLLDFVLCYASIIGLETSQQLIDNDITPDIVIGCVGGGSSFGGFAIPVWERFRMRPLVYCAESCAIPTLTKGKYGYDHPDGEGKAPKLLMHSVGYDFRPPPMHSSGLRYHAAAPIVSHFVDNGAFHAVAFDEAEAMKEGIRFGRAEGFIPSPESSYTLKTIAHLCQQHQGKTIVALMSGNGQLDIESYANFLC